MDESDAIPKGEPTTQLQRFSGFALCHICYSPVSLIFAHLFYTVAGELGAVMTAMLPIALIALYFPLGMLTARLSGWTRPQTRREKVWVIALPTLMAWLWVAVVLLSIGGAPEELFLWVFGISLLLAAPSSLFVMTLIAFWDWAMLPATGDPFVILGSFGIVAGILPTLLFALGSFYQAGWRSSPVIEKGETNG